MSKENPRRPVKENRSSSKEKDVQKPNYNLLSKHLKKVYPVGVYKASTSPLSLSSSSLSLSQNSSDSLTDSSSTLDQKIAAAIRLIIPREKRDVPTVARYMQKLSPSHNGEGLNREAFAGFDPSAVAKLGEKEIMEISSNKAIMLAESRVRCIVDNAKCIERIVKEYGSFSGYIWGYVDYKPVINRFRYPRNVPLRSPKAEAISKDLLKRGFRFVGPVIVYSFMQAAGMTIDHLVDCFRFIDCVSHAERPWRHV